MLFVLIGFIFLFPIEFSPYFAGRLFQSSLWILFHFLLSISLPTLPITARLSYPLPGFYYICLQRAPKSMSPVLISLLSSSLSHASLNLTIPIFFALHKLKCLNFAFTWICSSWSDLYLNGSTIYQDVRVRNLRIHSIPPFPHHIHPIN